MGIFPIIAVVQTNSRRLQDWLCGITHTLPADDGNTIAADTAAEEIRSVFDAVTGSRSKGGAGIESTYSGWRNITNSFPLHDPDAYSRILQRWRRKFVWTVEDLDTIRTTFGEKVRLFNFWWNNAHGISRSRYTVPFYTATSSFSLSQPS